MSLWLICFKPQSLSSLETLRRLVGRRLSFSFAESTVTDPRPAA
jgi:hypothetical protein